MAAATTVASTPTPTPKIEMRDPAPQPDTSNDIYIMALLERLVVITDVLSMQLAEEQATDLPGYEPNPPAIVAVLATPAPTPTPALSVWEDGTCWTPADMQVLHLCGADAGDGYVIRWIGVHGDSRGPEIPDADWLAGQRAVAIGWCGAAIIRRRVRLVTVNYWSGGHTLAVHAAGRLLVRIDRNHFVTQ